MSTDELLSSHPGDGDGAVIEAGLLLLLDPPKESVQTVAPHKNQHQMGGRAMALLLPLR